MKKQKGLSLTELLISQFIGIVLILGVIQLSVASNKNIYFQSQMTLMYENARFSINDITKVLRNVNFKAEFNDLDNKESETWKVINVNQTLVAEYEQIKHAYLDNDALYINVLGSENYYYLAPSTQKDVFNQSYPALFLNDNELVQSVEKMIVYLGVDYDFDEIVDQYILNKDFNWNNKSQILSVRLDLSMRSLDKIDGQYLTKNFSTTIALRN